MDTNQEEMAAGRARARMVGLVIVFAIFMLFTVTYLLVEVWLDSLSDRSTLGRRDAMQLRGWSRYLDGFSTSGSA